MSGHADTIRNFIHDDSRCIPADIPEFAAQDEADDALDALVAENQQLRIELQDLDRRLHVHLSGGVAAENQRLRDALEQIDAAGGVEVRYGGQIAGAMKDIARAALAGTPSEATG
jgi:tRNA A37 threonylcarbamoyltransferase TsaD